MDKGNGLGSFLNFSGKYSFTTSENHAMDFKVWTIGAFTVIYSCKGTIIMYSFISDNLFDSTS